MPVQEFSTRLSIYRHRIDAAERIFADWKNDHQDAMRVRTLEEIFHQFVDVARIVEAGIEEITAGFFNKEEDSLDYNSRRKLVESADRLLAIFEGVIAEAVQFTNKGYSVKYLDEMQNSSSTFKQAVDLLRRTCPAPNRDVLSKTAANIQHGQVRPAAELLNEAKSRHDRAG